MLRKAGAAQGLLFQYASNTLDSQFHSTSALYTTLLGYKNLRQTHKILLNRPHTSQTSTSNSPNPPYHSSRSLSRHPKGCCPTIETRGLAIKVEIARRVPECLLSIPQRFSVLREYGTRESIVRCLVHSLADIDEGLRGVLGVVVDVNRNDWTEELGTHEFVVWVRGDIDGRVDEEAFLAVVASADDAFKLGVVLRFVDDFAQLVEALLVDHGPDEVVELVRSADLELLRLFDQSRFDLLPEALRVVSSACGAALLALVLESSSDCVEDHILDICTPVNDVIVLSARLTNDARIALVSPFCGRLDQSVRTAHGTQPSSRYSAEPRTEDVTILSSSPRPGRLE